MAVQGLTPGRAAALAGTDGTPSDANRYVTNSDPRLTGGGGGAPSGPAGGSLSGTYPNPGIALLAVGTAQLQDAAVVTAKIADLNVTAAKIAAGAISGTKIAALAVDPLTHIDGSAAGNGQFFGKSGGVMGFFTPSGSGVPDLSGHVGLKRDAGAYGDCLINGNASITAGASVVTITSGTGVPSFASNDYDGNVAHPKYLMITRARHDVEAFDAFYGSAQGQGTLVGVIKAYISATQVRLGNPDPTTWSNPTDPSTAPNLNADFTVSGGRCAWGHNDLPAMVLAESLLPGNASQGWTGSGARGDQSGGTIEAEPGNYMLTTAGQTGLDTLRETSGMVEPGWPTASGASVMLNGIRYVEAGAPAGGESAWAAQSAYNVGDTVVPTTANGHKYTVASNTTPILVGWTRHGLRLKGVGSDGYQMAAGSGLSAMGGAAFVVGERAIALLYGDQTDTHAAKTAFGSPVFDEFSLVDMSNAYMADGLRWRGSTHGTARHLYVTGFRRGLYADSPDKDSAWWEISHNRLRINQVGFYSDQTSYGFFGGDGQPQAGQSVLVAQGGQYGKTVATKCDVLGAVAYSVGNPYDVVNNPWLIPTTPNGHYYQVTAAPAINSTQWNDPLNNLPTEPTWPTAPGSTVTTGSWTFKESGIVARWDNGPLRGSVGFEYGSPTTDAGGAKYMSGPCFEHHNEQTDSTYYPTGIWVRRSSQGISIHGFQSGAGSGGTGKKEGIGILLEGQGLNTSNKLTMACDIVGGTFAQWRWGVVFGQYAWNNVAVGIQGSGLNPSGGLIRFDSGTKGNIIDAPTVDQTSPLVVDNATAFDNTILNRTVMAGTTAAPTTSLQHLPINAGTPSGGSDGMLVIDSTNHALCFKVGGTWYSLTPGGGGASAVQSGTGSPAGVVSASPGTIWIRTDGPPWEYVKVSGTGTTGWKTISDIDQALGGDLSGTLPNPTVAKLNGIAAASYALLASPAFTGVPTAPTAAPGTNTTQIATTAYADAIAALKANLASPTLTGTPAGPTAAVDTNTTQLATTAYVIGQLSAVADGTPVMDGTAARGTSTHGARADHVHPTDTSRAPLASPGFTGTPTAPTPTATDSSTKIATTAFVDGIQMSGVESARPAANAVQADSTYYATDTHTVWESDGTNWKLISKEDQWLAMGSQFTRQNYDRGQAGSNIASLTSGVMMGVVIELFRGDVVTNITFRAGSTGAGTPTHWFFALYDPSGNLLAQTADQLTAAWAANSVKTLALSAAQTITASGAFYVALMVAATTVPTMAARPATHANGAGAVIAGVKPLGITFGSALTTTAPSTTTGNAVSANQPWAMVS